MTDTLSRSKARPALGLAGELDIPFGIRKRLPEWIVLKDRHVGYVWGQTCSAFESLGVTIEDYHEATWVEPTSTQTPPLEQAGLTALLGKTNLWNYNLARSAAEAVFAQRIAELVGHFSKESDADVGRAETARRIETAVRSLDAKIAAVDAVPLEEALNQIDLSALFDDE